MEGSSKNTLVKSSSMPNLSELKDSNSPSKNGKAFHRTIGSVIISNIVNDTWISRGRSSSNEYLLFDESKNYTGKGSPVGKFKIQRLYQNKSIEKQQLLVTATCTSHDVNGTEYTVSFGSSGIEKKASGDLPGKTVFDDAKDKLTKTELQKLDMSRDDLLPKNPIDEWSFVEDLPKEYK